MTRVQRLTSPTPIITAVKTITNDICERYEMSLYYENTAYHTPAYERF